MIDETAQIGTLLDGVASERVAPASGSVTALIGAFGTALVEMAVIHTRMAREDTTISSGVTSAGELLSGQRSTLLTLADADARTVDWMSTESQPPTQKQRKRGTGVPLTIARSCTTVLEVTNDDVIPVSDRVRPDLVAGLTFVRMAGITALHIVADNLDTIDNRQVREELGSQATAVRETLRNTTKGLEARLETELNQ